MFAFIAGLISLDMFDTDTSKIKRTKKYFFTGIGTIIGLIIMEFSIIIYISPEYTEFILGILTPISIFCLFPIIGIFMLYEGFSSIIKPSKYSTMVSAKCIDIKTYVTNVEVNGRMTYKTTYCPLYEYSFNENLYKECDNIYTDKTYCPDNDSIISLFINPDSPNLFWDVNRRKVTGKFSIILGSIFILVSIGIVLLLTLTK